MNKRSHLITEIIGFLILWGFFEQITITLIVLPILWGTMFPDFDHQLVSHRNVLFHSVIPNFLIWFFIPTLQNMLLTISVAIHLLGDVIPMIQGKKGGFSTIHLFFKRINSKWSIFYMTLNIIFSIIFFVLVV